MPARTFKLAISLLVLGGMASCDSGQGFIELSEPGTDPQVNSAEQDHGANSNDQMTANAQGLIWDENVWDDKKWQ